MKPNGIALRVSTSGGIRIGATTPSKTEDAIWEAVETAINEGWAPERFRTECAEAWKERLHDEARHAEKVLCGKEKP